VGEDQLALAPGVAGVDHAVDVLALQQLVDHVQLLLRFRVARPDLELGRDDGQGVELPRLPRRVVVLRVGELEQVPDGEGDDVPVAFVERLVVVEAAGKRVDDVARNGRLFGDDQGLHRAAA
jgi:hypothetical protein